MKPWSKTLIVLGIWGGIWSAWAARAPELEVTAAIHAIQQAPDPSAVVAAYANGVAVDRSNSRVHEAYIARMVEFGLPELAYRQARTLTTLVSSNGLAWAVVAHVDARRGDMPNAVSALNMAGQFAPEHQFVQRTAGEILAWYDSQPDLSQMPENARRGLANVRNLVQNREAYASAYDTARKAYEAQPDATEAREPLDSGDAPAVPQRPSLVETNAPGAYLVETNAPGAYAIPSQVPPPVVYPETYSYYAIDPGPRWIDPAPWWWWQPMGYWSGVHFVPYASVVLFHRHHHYRSRYHHHSHYSHGGRGDDRPRSWDSLSSHDRRDGGRWHRDRDRGGRSFYGRPAEPDTRLAQNPGPLQPSWSVLNPNRGLERNGTFRSSQPAVNQRGSLTRTPPASWSPQTGVRSSAVSRPNSTVAAPPRATAPSPSWSGLGQRPVAPGYSRPPTVTAPQTSRPAPAPSWSTLGRGSAAPSSRSSAPARSSSSSSRSGPSWSSLGK